MNIAQVLTPWNSTGGLNSPKLLADHPTIAAYRDATDQPPANIPPTPNLFTAEITCDDATLTAIEADANYTVLWSEPL
jgi:hypothetical protein